MDVNTLVAQLRIDEGVKYSVYQDSLGYWTIGVGHLVDARRGGVISDDVVNQLLQGDIQVVVGELNNKLPWWTNQPEPIQQVLANMCFNLGINALLGFTTFLQMVQAGNYSAAADDMLTTKWASQVGQRATRLATVVRSTSQSTSQTVQPAPQPPAQPTAAPTLDTDLSDLLSPSNFPQF